MTLVKNEEESMEYGFSHTRLGMEKTLAKQKAGKNVPRSSPDSAHTGKKIVTALETTDSIAIRKTRPTAAFP
jgi:hypothetical protein